MYVPAHFATDDAHGLIARLARRWAGVLVTVDEAGMPVGTHMPILWDAEKRIATGHIARANPQWKQGAAPTWYPSKAEHGKAVPTWNYEAVHISGAVEWFEDAVRLEAMLHELSTLHEHDRAEPWAMSDAPRPYVDALMRGIVGVTLTAERIEAKRKLSQNKNEADFVGVACGLAASGEPMAKEVAELMRAERALSDDPNGN